MEIFYNTYSDGLNTSLACGVFFIKKITNKNAVDKYERVKIESLI